MRRPLLVFLAVGIAIGLVSPGAAAGTPPPVPTSAAVAGEPATVTASGEALIDAGPDPLSVYMIQLQGIIDPKDPSTSLDAYVAKLQRIRQAVIGAGVPDSAVTPASYSTNPLGASASISFNSVFRYEVRPNATSVSAARAAFAAGASMVYNNMPAPAVGLRRPDGAALDGAIAEAMGRARDYAARVIAPRSVGEARASTLVIRGEPDSAPVSWRVQVTVTFVVR